MIIYKITFKPEFILHEQESRVTLKTRRGTWIYKGWYLFGFIPIYIKRDHTNQVLSESGVAQ